MKKIIIIAFALLFGISGCTNTLKEDDKLLKLISVEHVSYEVDGNTKDALLIQNDSTSYADLYFTIHYSNGSSKKVEYKGLGIGNYTAIDITSVTGSSFSKYELSVFVNENDTRYDNFDSNFLISITKQFVTLEFNKQGENIPLLGKVIVIFYDKDKNVVDIAFKDFDFDEQSISFWFTSLNLFKSAKIIEVFYLK